MSSREMPPSALKRLVREALLEDAALGRDLTTRFFIPRSARVRAAVRAKAPGILCGLKAAEAAFKIAAPSCRVKALKRDGQPVRPGDAVMRVEGGRELLSAERTALNLLCHLSGIATLTRAYVQKTRGTRARILDTRKTLPGLRALQKYAVKTGGGVNHRSSLSEAALVKDNHWALHPDLEASVEALRRKRPGVPLEIEAKSLREIRLALKARPDFILLDNMGRGRLKKAIAFVRRAAPGTGIEVSGGVTLRNVRRIARLGPGRISIGRLTHSAPALDMSLEVEDAQKRRAPVAQGPSGSSTTLRQGAKSG